MLEFLQRFFAESPFIPHGHCYLWKPGLVWLHITSDALIALAYYSIPLLLVYFVQKRKDLPFSWLFLLFSAFILSCGTTHVMEVWTLWHPTYWLAGFIKAITAIVSLYTAITLAPIIPMALTLPSPAELEATNRQLEAKISEHKLTEEALRESEQRWNLALQGNNDGIWDWNITTNQTFRSPRFQEIIGYEADALASSNEEWVARIHPDDWDRVVTANQDYLSRKIPYYAVEYRLLCKDGNYKWVLSRGQAQWDEAGNPVRMVGSMSDITKRKQTEISLYQLNVELEERVQERTTQLQAANHLLEGQKQVLEMLAKGASLSEVLNVLIQTVEEQSVEMQCSIVVFPKPLKMASTNVALTGGLRTCYSEPIFSSTGEVLGTVTGHYQKPRRSKAEDLQLRQTAAYIAGIAIEHEQVEQDRSRLVAIMEASSDFIGTADPQGNSLWYNTQLKKALKLDSNANITKRPINANHAHWAVELIENQGIPSAINDGIWIGETALLCTDGVEIPVSQMIIAHKSPNGDVEYFSTIMRDISDRKQAEASLRQSFNLLEAVINSSPDCIFVKDLEGRYQLMNTPGANLFNKSVEELIGQDDSALLPPEIAANFRESDRNTITSGKAETYEECLLVNGKWRTYITSKNVYRDAFGNILGIVGFGKDLSNLYDELHLRKQAEAALQASYNLLESIINATPDSIFVKNLQQRYLLSNAVRASLFNKSVPEIFGKDDSYLFPPELCAKIQAADSRIMASGNTETFEEVFVVEGEPRTYLTTKSVYRDADGKFKGLVGFAKDITPQKHSEQRLKALNAELVRSNQELEQFAYIASHDLREPLRKIKSYTDLLVKRYQGQLDEKADKYIAYITNGAERMQALITDLLTYSRVGKGELLKEPIDLHSVLHQTLSDLSPSDSRKQCGNYYHSLAHGEWQPRQMGQLLQNLISNAIKYRVHKRLRFKSKQCGKTNIGQFLFKTTASALTRNLRAHFCHFSAPARER
jgi:PAS domain S-box-containing protein